MIEKFISLRTLVLTAALASAACSSSSSSAAPVIDDFEAPASVTADADGVYTVEATFSAHDDASAITAIGVRATGLKDNPIATDGQHSYVNQPFKIMVVGRAERNDGLHVLRDRRRRHVVEPIGDDR
ncbi:MAG TPA: hypothetical protein VF407_24535, partial [Polyangiaceae bacterium]